MADPTPEDIQAAYDVVYACEKTLAERVIDATNAFYAELDNISTSLSTNAFQSPVGQLIQQFSNMKMVSNNSIPTVRSFYNIPDPNAPAPIPYTPPPPQI